MVSPKMLPSVTIGNWLSIMGKTPFMKL